MGKLFYLRIGLLMGIPLGLFGQVGINTRNPQGVLHIDPKRNTPASGATSAQFIDDILVNSFGDLTIGMAPGGATSAKVTIVAPNGTAPLKLADGTQGGFKVLTAYDNSGLAYWKSPQPVREAQMGYFGSGVRYCIDPDYNKDGVVARPKDRYIKTSGEIILGKGTWWVRVNLFLKAILNTHNSEQVWVRTTLADDATYGLPHTGTTPGDFQITNDMEYGYWLASALVWKNGNAGVITGSFLLKNTSTSKKYYLCIGWPSSYSSSDTQKKTVYEVGSEGEGNNGLVAYKIAE